MNASRQNNGKPLRFSIDCIEDLPKKLSQQKFAHIIQKFLADQAPEADSSGLLSLFEDFYFEISNALQSVVLNPSEELLKTLV